jgi:Cdc6-like AAA superfamily ATPase
MSMELDVVIDSCVKMLQSDPQRTREEIAQLLNRWEEKGYISRQMRAVIVQRLRSSQQDRDNPGSSEDSLDQALPQ